MLVFQACGEEKKEEESTDKEDEAPAPEPDDQEEVTPADDETIESGEQETSTESVNSRYAYDQDWEIIRDAILDKDVAALKASRMI